MQSANLQVEHRTEPWGMLLTVRGSAAVADIPALERHVNPIVASKPPLLVIDVSEMVFISSLGIGVFISLHRGLRPEGRVRIAGANPEVQSVFDRARFSAVVPLFPTVEDAIREPL